jgi:signal transduction histidine kinase
VSLRSLFRPTVRLRLTLLYGGLFLLVGAVLLVVNYFVVRRNLTVEPAVLRERIELRLGRSLFSFQTVPSLADNRRLETLLRAAAGDLRQEALHSLIVESITAFVAMAVACLGLGWLVAARALRPLKQITGAARRLSDETLHERIDLEGPEDELKELADTFDEMLGRLDAAFDSQRRFVANASHELRTPLSIIRAELDVTMSNPSPSLDEFRAMADVVRQATDRSERLIDSLLTLARGESTVVGKDPVDLEALGERVVERVRRQSDERGVRVETAFRPARLSGDEVLLERLIENLVENGIRYNVPGGWVSLATEMDESGARIVVTNTGEDVGEDEIESLFEPFRRRGADRVRSGRGLGLGLAIARSVARAHGGSIEASRRAEGGLEVAVRLPTPRELAPAPV